MEDVTIPEAARRLGISRSAVRRRLQSGQLTGRQEPRPQGHIWLVTLPAGAGTSRQVPADADTFREVPRQVPAGAADDSPAAPQMALEAMRAAGMASYTRELLEPLHARLEAQAERIGRLELELEQSRARVAELEAVPVSNGQAETQNAAPGWPERRRWWQRLVWG
jgi:hypothetical protein